LPRSDLEIIVRVPPYFAVSDVVWLATGLAAVVCEAVATVAGEEDAGVVAEDWQELASNARTRITITINKPKDLRMLPPNYFIFNVSKNDELSIRLILYEPILATIVY
jgi:hypothetical protein